MCLRFVAGLTHLEHESYQQYFNKQQKLILQCKRNPLFGFESCHLCYFYQNPKILSDHISSCNFGDYSILLFQLLYESQNTTLCHVLAQSINNHSLCLDGVSLSLSLFDWLCLSYCINNSNTTWNHLHLGHVSIQSLSVFTAGLTSNSLQTQCKGLEVKLPQHNDELLQNFLQPSLLCNIQECHCVYDHEHCTFVVDLLTKFLNLPQLKSLHLSIPAACHRSHADKCTKLEKCIEMNSTLQEMKIEFNRWTEIAMISVIKGVTRNKTIISLTLKVSNGHPLPDGVIEQLLKDNNTLKALSLSIPNHLLPSSLNIVEVNTPLTALEIGPFCDYKLIVPLLPLIKGLHCLRLHASVDQVPYPPHLLFHSHPSLDTLTLPLGSAKSAIELFTILQTNTTLKALRVTMFYYNYTSQDSSSVGKSLKIMLKKNQSLKYFEIMDLITSSFLSFLTNGIRHNTSIQQLHVWIPPTDIKTFIDVISQRNNLTELDLNLDIKHYTLLYEKVLPAITNMLQSHTTMRLLKIYCGGINQGPSDPKWIEMLQHLFKTIFNHPSLEYIKMHHTHDLLRDTFKDQKKTLIDRHRKEQPHKPLPIVIID